MLKIFLIKNLDIIFLVYGLSFVIMAIAIFVQPRRESVFKLSGVIWLLAAFGLSHGINEWLDMISIIKSGGLTMLPGLRTIILTISYIFLFEFGRKLIMLSCKKPPSSTNLANLELHLEVPAVRKVFYAFLCHTPPGIWLTAVMALFVFMLTLLFKTEPTIWPRYFLGFPGGLLTAGGFILYFHTNRNILKFFKFRHYFIIAAISIGFYSIFSGIIVPKAPFFPASIINNNSFLDTFGIPVQVFRTLCAIILSWSVYNILNIFEWEIIAELKTSLREVSLAKRYVENILKSLSDSLLVLDENAKILTVNETACRILGYSEQELLGKPAEQIFEGTPFTGQNFKKLIKEQIVKNAELICISKGSAKIPLLFSESVMKTEDGKIAGIVAVGKDMRELRNLKEKLNHSEKLAAMGRVASIIGHEFRNQLGVMRNSIYLLKFKLQNIDENIKRYLVILDEQVMGADRIIENILSFAATGHPEFKTVDIKDILLSSTQRVAIPEQVLLDTQIENNLPQIIADKIQLARVFVNIIINAIEAMKEKGELKIEAKKEGEFINISFLDTGCGISEESKNRIFEPFFSTKASGIGLGLFTAKSIIEAHSGSIKIESRTEKGTIITILLPIGNNIRE